MLRLKMGQSDLRSHRHLNPWLLQLSISISCPSSIPFWGDGFRPQLCVSSPEAARIPLACTDPSPPQGDHGALHSSKDELGSWRDSRSLTASLKMLQHRSLEQAPPSRPQTIPPAKNRAAQPLPWWRAAVSGRSLEELSSYGSVCGTSYVPLIRQLGEPGSRQSTWSEHSALEVSY